MTDAEPRINEPPAQADKLQALQELTEALAHAASEDALFQQAVTILRSTLELPCIAILVFDATMQLRFRASHGLSQDFQGGEEIHCPWTLENQDPQPMLADDITQVPALEPCRARLLAEGIHSLALSPLMSQERLFGGILLGSHTRRHFTPEELRFTAAVANLLGFSAARTRQEADLVDTAAFSQRLLDNANVMVVGLDREGTVVVFNETAERISGYRKAEIQGRNWFELAVPRVRYPFVWDYFRQLQVSSAAPREAETPLLTKEGQERLVSWRNSVFPEANARVATLSFGIDVTDVRRQTEALRASEELFSKVFHLSPDAIDLTRLEDGVSLDCNNSYLKLTGFAREEVIGHSTLPGDLGVWVHKADRDRHIAELHARGEVLDLETPLRRKDGSVYIALISSSLLEIAGQPCNLSLTRDITERKRAEEALRESTQRLQLALASGNLGIWDRNLLDDTEIWNDRMFELYGVERTVIEANYAVWAKRIVHPDDIAGIHESVRAALAGGQPYDLKFRIVRPDGTVRHIKSNGIVIREADGRAIRVIGINRDRTEQVEAEAERRRLQAEVHHAEKLESIGSLAGGMAHDMNNVLTAILITAELLQGECQPGDSMARSLGVILHAGQRGRDLVKALMDFARKGLEEASLVDLNEVLRKEVEVLRYTTLKKVQVVLELDDRLPVILGAASELGSAIMNLSINAVDAMPAGGTLTFRSSTLPDGRIELAVADTGHGMSAEVRAKAMEPFYTTKPVGKGTGLGLSRVYGTVRAHGGTVEIESRMGEGTTVILRLPANTASGREATPSDGAELQMLGQYHRILLVDDERIILESVPAMLKAIGHTVETATLGEEALGRPDLCQGFDLVILDHNMPGLTGIETLLQLRSRCPELPVIFSTGFMDAKTEGILAGIPHVWVLKKPYSIQEIQKTLSHIPHP